MRCLVDGARTARGLPSFGAAAGLDRAATRKSADILRCGEFTHEACGREFSYWIRRFGHFGAGCSGIAENIAWGTGSFATPRAIFRAWMRSPGHRRNILGSYGLVGIGMRVGALEGRSGAHVWTQEFAGRDC
ncbi:MAG: CAP domain-containing protein [Solirubrobacterales bacterium]